MRAQSPPVIEGAVTDMSNLLLWQAKVTGNVGSNLGHCPFLLSPDVIRFADLALMEHHIKSCSHILNKQVAACGATCGMAVPDSVP